MKNFRILGITICLVSVAWLAHFVVKFFSPDQVIEISDQILVSIFLMLILFILGMYLYFFSIVNNFVYLRKYELLIFGGVLFLSSFVGGLILDRYYKNTATFLADSELGWVINPAMNPPSGGFNESEVDFDNIDSSNLIFAIGDSFTQSSPYDDNFITILDENLPNLNIINLGVSGYSPDQYYKILKRYLDIKIPRMVLINFYVGNDIVNNSNPGFFKNEGLIEKVRQIIYRLEHSLTQSNLSETFNRKIYLHTEKNNLQYTANEYSPELENFTNAALQDLAKIIELSKRKGFQLMFIIIPDAYQVHSGVREEIYEFYNLDPEDYDVLKVNKMTRAFLEDQEVFYLDLTDDFIELGEEEYFYQHNDIHWNAKGMNLAASLIAPKLSIFFNLINEQDNSNTSPMLRSTNEAYNLIKKKDE